jgi:arginine decarboxylase
VDQLKQHDSLDALALLHSHIGSQIPDIADIGRGMAEAARYFIELRRAGAPLRVLDVGGGLGVDYEGSASRHYCSINYSTKAYAREVLSHIQQRCADEDMAPPLIFSESGRAMTAHHAVLITEVIERESPSTPIDAASQADPAPLVQALAELRQQLDQRSPLHTWQETHHLFEQAQQAFAQGELALSARAHAEQLYYAIAAGVKARLRVSSRRHRDLLDQLTELLANRVFCNFSLFQSLPDVWAIDQIFPIMPLHRLDEAPQDAAVMHDLTCDSDGCIAQYVDQDGVETTLKLHAQNDQPYLLGIFLVGAYQEILGDMHNLFGDTDAVNLALDGQGGYRLAEPERGDSVDELLRYVHFEPQQMLERYRQKLAANGSGGRELDGWFRELKAALHGTTYLTE